MLQEQLNSFRSQRIANIEKKQSEALVEEEDPDKERSFGEITEE
jgi:hypothetical protein